MKILIPFLIAVFIHIAFIFAGNTIYKPAEVHFEHGESAIEMKLVASIESPQNSKPLTVENDVIKEEVLPIEQKVEPEPVAVIEEIVEDMESLVQVEEKIKDILKEETPVVENKLVEKDIPEPDIDEVEEEPVVKEEVVEEEKEVVEEVVEEEEERDLEVDTALSTEIVADMLDKGISSPSVTGVRKPRYPLSCRNAGHEGNCVLEAVIDSRGSCVEINIIQTAGCAKLDKAAIKVLKKAKYTPAEQFGLKVNSTKKMVFRFRIEDLD